MASEQSKATARPRVPEPDPAGDVKVHPSGRRIIPSEDPEAPVRRVGRRRAAGPSRGRIAANDDGPSIGGLLYALHQTPSKRPFHYAIGATAVWALLSGVLGWAMLGGEVARSGSWAAALTTPTAISLAATVAIPIALFWFLAMLVWRAQELKLMSSAMTEVAVRLAEPDRMAEQAVASLGQSVRRQVGAMNDAISRALGRAGELEALVHSEVAALERSYGDNEMRIRSLIEELSSERAALENKSDDVSTVLRGIGENITRDISIASEQAAQAIAEASSRLSHAIDAQGNQASVRLREAGDRINHVMEQGSARAAHLMSDKGNALLASLSEMNQRIGSEVPTIIEKLGHEQTRLTKILEGAGKNLAALETVLTQRTGNLETALGERTRHLQGVLEDQTRTFDATVGQHVDRVEGVIERTQAAISHAIESRTLELEDRTKALDAALIERTKAIDSAFSARIEAIELAFSDNNLQIDRTVSERAEELHRAMERHAGAVRDSLEQQASDIDGTLLEGLRAVRRSSEDIAQQSLQTMEGLASQAQMLKHVSEDLLGQIESLTSRFENQGGTILKAAHALDSSNFKLDEVLAERQSELSKLLDQLSERAGNFDAMMRDYSAGFEGSLRNAGTIAEQETRRTLDELRARFSSASTEMHDQLSGLSTRLDDTRREISHRKREAELELEDATSELSERARRLPEATRQSAETMRKALDDQLRAIERVSQIAGRNGAGKPAPSRPARDSEIQPRRPSSGGTSSSGTSGGLIRPRHNPFDAAASGGASTARRGTPSDSSSETRATRSRAELRNEVRAAAQRAALEGDDRGGWSMGDLLERASRDDRGTGSSGRAAPAIGAAVAGGAHAGGGIDFRGIAEALDADAAVTLWSRYRKGELDRVSTDLYSPRGRKAFDEVSRRYGHDTSFRATVDRYLLDFERVLRDSDTGDGGASAQGKLLSEPGRVYLLLAHATGRLS